MPTPYPVKFKLPLEYLTLQDWNNFVKNLLFLNQYGSAQLLKYYQNGNFQDINDVIAKYLYVSALKVAGYNVLHNLSEPLAYTFGEGNQQPFESMSQRPTVNFPYSIPFEFIQFYPISELSNYKLPIFPVEKLQVQLSAVSKQLQLLIPKLTSKIITPSQIAGTQFQFSGSTTVQTLIENYLDPTYLQSWREIIIQNLGNSPVQINNSIYLMPKNCLKITANSPSEIQLTAQTPTLLSEEIEFVGIPITFYTITITNSQSDPTPSPFQQLLNLNLSSILSSSSQLLNLEFCLDAQCNTPLYAWIESYNSNLSSVYIWINLPTSIPANSSITIYMFVRNSIQYPYTGMAPQLTSTYGQYDNGENVFTFYDNFAGTSLKSSWTPFGTVGTITVNNGLTLSGGSAWWGIKNTYIVSSPLILEYFGKQTQTGGYGPAIGTYTGVFFEQRTADSSPRWGIEPTSSGNTSSGTYGGSSSYNTWYLVSGIYVSGSPELITNYITTQVTATYSLGSSNLVLASFTSSTSVFQWVRVRVYPPNGTMPSNSQPQKTIILLS